MTSMHIELIKDRIEVEEAVANDTTEAMVTEADAKGRIRLGLLRERRRAGLGISGMLFQNC